MYQKRLQKKRILPLLQNLLWSPKKETPPPVAVTPSVVPEVKKQDTVIASSPSVTVVPKQIKDANKKTSIEQVIVPKKDTTQINTTAKTKPDTVKKTTVDTASASKNKDMSAKKKKKKRKTDVTEDIRQSTQQPNSADDDVVVPNN